MGKAARSRVGCRGSARSRGRVLVLAGALLVALTVTAVALASGSRTYVQGRYFNPSTAYTDGIHHNHNYNVIDPRCTCMPSGLYFKTDSGIKTGVVNGYGTISAQTNGAYYNVPYCWNRSSTNRYYVNSCVAVW
jgi:hypothetical protein